jgi:hypothetical protein
MAARRTVVGHTDINIVVTTLKEADSEMCRLQAIGQAIADAKAGLTADIAEVRECTKISIAHHKKEQVKIRKRLVVWAKRNYRRIIFRRDKSLCFMYGTIKYQDGRYRICPNPPVARKKIVDTLVDVNPTF